MTQSELQCFCGELQAILFAMREEIRALQGENLELRDRIRVLEDRFSPRPASPLRGGLGQSRWRGDQYRRDPTRRTGSWLVGGTTGAYTW
ncbi:hypothetical protein V8E54_000550 [Elaphomyces granulatus]